MRESTSIIYIADDGKQFTNRKEAEKYEQTLKNVKSFVVRYSPDLTEGRGYQKVGIIMVHVNSNHQDFAEHWCYKEFGNRISFCMGVYGSNAIMDSWLIKEAKDEDMRHPVIHKIEEEFVVKIWT